MSFFRKPARYRSYEDPPHAYHSQSYHRFFEGYEEHEVLGANGKVKIERVYTGTWYILNLPRLKRIMLQISYVLLSVLAFACFLFAFTYDSNANRQWYIVIFQACAFLGFGWVAVSLINYLTRPAKMTIYEYKSSCRSLTRSTCCSALSCTLTWLLALVDSCIIQNAADAAYAFLFLLAGILVMLVNCIERSLKYREQKNSSKETHV